MEKDAIRLADVVESAGRERGGQDRPGHERPAHELQGRPVAVTGTGAR
jgi:hypothetical protein